MGGSNVLVERFNEVPEFAAMYDAALAELTESLFVDGTAEAILQRWAAVLSSEASDVVSAATVESDVQAVRAAFPAE